MLFENPEYLTKKFYCNLEERWSSKAVPSSKLLGAEDRLQFHVSRCEICGGQRDTDRDFSEGPSVFPYQYHSTNTPYLSASEYYSSQEDKRAKPGNPETKQCSFGYQRTLDKKVVSSRTQNSLTESTNPLIATLLQSEGWPTNSCRADDICCCTKTNIYIYKTQYILDIIYYVL